LRRSRIPVEICPTSNLRTKGVAHLREHPFGQFLQPFAPTGSGGNGDGSDGIDSDGSGGSGSGDIIDMSSFGGVAGRHPMSICTDDLGVFEISLSLDIFRMTSAWEMSQAAVVTLARGACDLVFATGAASDDADDDDVGGGGGSGVRRHLHALFDEFERQLMWSR
jgi:hypothetical protein